MRRYLLAALMTVTAFDFANAKFQPPAGIQECNEDAKKFCNGSLYDVEKRQACMRAHWKQLSPSCIAAAKHQGLPH